MTKTLEPRLVNDLLVQLEAGTAQFADVISLIDMHYQHTPTAFQNGAQHNSAEQNQGSAKVLSFAKLNGLDQAQTLHLFAEHYQSVLANIIGCICAGVFFAASERFVSLQGEWRLFLMVGILGGFTTFSSFGLESFQLLKLGHYGLVLSYVLSSVLVGICALALSYYGFRAFIFQ